MDPITLSVITNGFKSIVNEMNLALFRSAYSPVITEGRDIGGAVIDRHGRLVAQGDWDLAVFVALLEFSLQGVLKRFSEDINPGDVFIMNDPFVGGTHFNDVGVVRPVFSGGHLMAFVAVCGHWADVGGQEPGSFVANAREHFQEGLRLPPMKLYIGGEPNLAVFDVIEANMRIASERLGDVRAQVGSTQIGEQRLLELASKYGWEQVTGSMDEAIAHSERMLRSEISQIPDGQYRGEDFVDMESLDRPIPKKIALELTVDGDSLHFDFTGSDPESLSASNSTYSSTASAVYVTVKSLFPEIPMNHGVFKPIRITAPEGTVVNARPPRAISSMAATVYEKVIGAALIAISKALPEQAVGTPYNLINLTIGGRYQDSDFVAYLYSEGGFGARATKDGAPGLVSLYGGGAKITPVEVFERRYPIVFEEWALWPDSGGAGRYRGGVGSRKTFRIVDAEVRLSCLGDREHYPPPGVLGGAPGAKHGLIRNIATPEEENLTLKAVGFPLQAGDTVTILAGGGGGYGDPLNRDPALVANDVSQGYVTVEHAAREYGVVISEMGEVAVQETERLRTSMRNEETQ